MSKTSIVMYHYVRELTKSRYPEIKGLDLSLFRQQIKFLKENYNIIPIEQVIDAIDTNKDLPPNSMTLTFDDGYIDHYTNVVPILLENNIQAFFSMPAKILAEGKVLDVNKIHFILASASINELINKVFERLDYYRGKEFNIENNNVLYERLATPSRFDNKDVVFVKRLLQAELPERLRNIIVDDLFKSSISLPEDVFAKELYLSYDQIKAMKKMGMTFGIHGYDHYWLGKLSNNEMERDVNKALDFFDGIIDKKNWIMCYPSGSYNEHTIKYISENGCKLGLSTEVKVADIKADNRYTLARLDTNDYPPKSNEYLKR